MKEFNGYNYDSDSNESIERGCIVTTTSDEKPQSYLYDNVWDFSGMQKIGAHKSAEVHFKKIGNTVYRRAIQEVAFRYYNSEKPSVGVLKGFVSRLKVITELLGSSNWNQLDEICKWREFKSSIDGKYGQGYLEHIGSVINFLAKFEFIERTVLYSELYPLARQGSDTKQHIAIPLTLYQIILSKCIKTVQTYHPYRHEISKVMAKAIDIYDMAMTYGIASSQKGAKEWSVLSKKEKSKRIMRAIQLEVIHDIPGFSVDLKGSWTGLIMTECLMICAMFSGARLGEIITFNKESYRTRDTINGEIAILEGATTKGNNGVEKVECWQTHPIVKDALELAFDMMEFSRKRRKNFFIKALERDNKMKDRYQRALEIIELSFMTPNPTNNDLKTYVLNAPAAKTNKFLRNLNYKATVKDVEEFNRLNPSRRGQLNVGGTLPKLSPHDFRRSFAVFMKRYGFGNDMTIKFHYKHRNINMSAYYANNAQLSQMHDVLLDKELLKIMEEEGIQLGVDVFDEIYNESSHLSGGEGERIANDRFKKLQNGQKVYMSRAEIEKSIRSGALSIVQLPTGGYCTNSDCERLCGVDEFIVEKNNCPHQIITDKVAKKQVQHRERLINKFRMLNTGDKLMNHILSGLKQRIIQVESVLKKHEICYEEFTDKIEGCYVS